MDNFNEYIEKLEKLEYRNMYKNDFFLSFSM